MFVSTTSKARACASGLRELAVSSGSACSSGSDEASYVLRALGGSDQLAQSSIRFSLGRLTTEDDIDRAIAIVSREVARLRRVVARCSWNLNILQPSSTTSSIRAMAGTSKRARASSEATAGSVAQGTMFVLSARVAGNRIEAVRFEAYGCPHCIAAGSWLSERLVGLDRDQLRAWRWRDADQALGIPSGKTWPTSHSGRRRTFAG